MELINFLPSLPLCQGSGTQLECSASSGLLGSTVRQPGSCLLSPVVPISLLPLTSTLLPIPISYLATVTSSLPANSSLQSLSKVKSHVILLFKNLEQLYMACQFPLHILRAHPPAVPPFLCFPVSISSLSFKAMCKFFHFHDVSHDVPRCGLALPLIGAMPYPSWGYVVQFHSTRKEAH